MQARSKRASPLNIAPAKNTSITSGLTCDAAEDDDVYLLGGLSLALDPAGDNISLLGENLSLTGGDVYQLGGESLRASTSTGHTRTSKFK